MALGTATTALGSVTARRDGRATTARRRRNGHATTRTGLLAALSRRYY